MVPITVGYTHYFIVTLVSHSGSLKLSFIGENHLLLLEFYSSLYSLLKQVSIDFTSVLILLKYRVLIRVIQLL